MMISHRHISSRVEPLPMHRAAVNLSSRITDVPVPVTNHSLSFPPADPPAIPFRECTPHDDSSFRHSVEDILQIILKSRKNWKTLKGQSEAVWPPYLEAIMLKGLQEYEPDDSRETRILGRYPMRNRFISDYIHSTTGKYRSAKQVGSRLQQLRDTPEGRKLIDVLTRCYRTRMDIRIRNACQPSTCGSSSSLSVSTISSDSDSTPSSSGSPVIPPSPTMPSFPLLQPRQPTQSRMPVYIDILPQPSLSSPTGHSPSSAAAAPVSNPHSRSSDAVRHIHNIDPTVTFVSPSPVNGKSSYIVLLDSAPVHSEDTTLECVGPYFASSTGRSSSDEPVLYNTPLVPKYWDVICKAADPTLYTIVQDVYCTDQPVPSRDHAQRPHPACIFSAIYHFQYHSSADPAPSYGQPVVDVSRQSSSGSSVTSAFDRQTLQGAIQMDFTRATSFPVPSTYTFPASEGLRTPIEVDQTPFDEPFVLDVNFQQIAFDDFVASMDTPNTYFM